MAGRTSISCAMPFTPFTLRTTSSTVNFREYVAGKRDDAVFDGNDNACCVDAGLKVELVNNILSQ